VFIEVAFKEAVDYKNSTGLMETNESILFLNYPDYIKEMAQGAVIWQVNEVESTFSGGKFEQVLTLVGPSFDSGESASSGEGEAGGQAPSNQSNQANGDDDFETDVQTDELDQDPFSPDEGRG